LEENERTEVQNAIDFFHIVEAYVKQCEESITSYLKLQEHINEMFLG
jgi:hypothetical protein